MTEAVPTTANEFVEHQLDLRLKAVEELFDANVLCMNGSLLLGVDDFVRVMIEEMRGHNNSRPRLVIILTTDGGYLDPVQRIVDTVRHHYDYVGFVIPNRAFSAGTVLAMSGDEIFMDYYSRLGPIDPQVQTAKGSMVPALGYLKQYERLVEKDRNGTLTLAEVQLMIEGFDQAELYKYEQARELSVSLLIDWLVNYKFKNWTVTQTKRRRVTEAMRKNRAEEIARELNNTDRWHDHGYGISMAVLRAILKLQINDLDDIPDHCMKVRQYDTLLSDYMQKIRVEGILHTIGKFLPFRRS